MTKEQDRIYSSLNEKIPPWRKWGTYVSERQWGTVREDYSANGDAWNYVTHDMARSKAYRWGEDGIAGWCDQFQQIVFSFAFWNGKDSILKERLFGLTPDEANHGEDVKEYYFYLDGTPTHSYMKYLYKYPLKAFPYEQLKEENKKRSTKDREYELVDTGIFNDGEYLDIFIEYAKMAEEDTCIKLEVCNRSKKEASLHILPQLFFRNRWSWNPNERIKKPEIKEGPFIKGNFASLFANPANEIPPDWLDMEYHIPELYLYGQEANELLFTNNETNNEKLYHASNTVPYVKDAFHRYVIEKEKTSVNPKKTGTKACFYYADQKIPANGSKVYYFRLSPKQDKKPLDAVEKTVRLRKQEADDFYESIHPKVATPEDKLIQRQALAGMIWSMQFYAYDVKKWLEGDNPSMPPPPSHKNIRNTHWQHVHSLDILSMPDKWEYPWFASWDMAFHTLVLSLIDLPLAKFQLKRFLKNNYQHPNGQIPAYEWGFSDTNPPVQAWALWHLYQKDRKEHGEEDRGYLEFCFLKLMQNFGWWVNKVDRMGNNVFEGGFLGLDNISIIDRSKPLPDGGFFEQTDATGWMGFFSLNMMRIALELAKEQPFFEQIAIVFLEHFFNIASAMLPCKDRPIDFWDEEDGFFYDILFHPNGTSQRLKLRSCVGLLPFCALDFFDEDELEKHPHFYKRFKFFQIHRKHITDRCITVIPYKGKKRFLLSFMTLEQMKRVLGRVYQQDEFLSSFGIRSLSKYHEKHPFSYNGSLVSYEPGESLEKIKGGNSNWRGPVWMPINFVFLTSLHRFSEAIGDRFEITSSGRKITLSDMEKSLKDNLINIFRKDKEGVRPVHGDNKLFHEFSEWKDLILFYEHYHGDTGRGLGASHQTGWSGIVAILIDGIKDV